MIISFSVENWMSFRESVSFSMVASRERRHGDRISKVPKYPIRILPVTAIYGGNASGKTNFCKALNFVKRLVLKGTEIDSPILVEPYLLDEDCLNRPSRFKLEVLVDEIIYEFSFSVTSTTVVEEKLVQITSASEKILYNRQDGALTLDSSFKKDQFLYFAFRGTRDNQLFLRNSVSQKVNVFRPIYDWFTTLELIGPDDRFESFEPYFDEGDPLYNAMNEILPQLDTGISRFGVEEVLLENLSLPERKKRIIHQIVKEDKPIRLLGKSPNERFIFTKRDGKLFVKKLVTFHPKSDGTEVRFDVGQESDGSQRLMDILPALLDISKGARKVYVIDEMDRSFHTLLTRELLAAYLAKCSPGSRSQLLITTHDVLLMDQKNLFRHDEMWVAERNQAGVSTLIPFSDYKDICHDKNIHKSYLQGRLGGVPKIFL